MSYIIDTSKGETPEVIAQRRKLSDALAARIFGRTPQNVGEGLSALGQAWIAGSMRDEADAAQKAGQASGNDAFSKLFGAISGGAPSGAVPNAGVAPMGNLSSMNSRVYSENEFNPIDAAAATPDELAAGVPAPKQYASLIGKAAVDNDIPPQLLAAQIKQESGFNPKAVSPVGASGISQFMPGTAKEMGVSDPFNPEQAIPAGARYLRQNIDKFGGSIPLGLAAYNAGPGRVAQSGGDISRLPAETQGYVANITNAAPVQDAGDAIPPGARPTQATGGQPAPSNGPDLNTLIKASTNPWLSESQRAVVNTMLQQKLKEQQLASDPLHQLQIQKAQADLEYGKNPESVREYQFAKSQGFTGSYQDWIAAKRGGAGEYGLTPVMGTGADGKPALLQLGKNGKPIQTPLPEGFSIARDPIKVEGPTGTSILDPQTRQVIQFIPKDVRGAASEHVIGESQGKIKSTLPSDIVSANQTITQIDQLLGNKGLDSIVGPLDQFRPSWTLGSEGRDALARFNQLKGKAFLQAYSTLRGGGAITEVEGVKAENAMARMDRAQSEEDFRAALRDFRDAVSVGLEKLKEKAGVLPSDVGSNAPASSPADARKTTSGVQWSVEK